jgi:hypothetical protein
MEKIYVKQLKTFVLNNEENKQMLINLNLIKDDIKVNKRPSKHNRSNIERVVVGHDADSVLDANHEGAE